jgi:5-hydroxyisourate hydrolase-like protein (transthyretin family)
VGVLSHNGFQWEDISWTNLHAYDEPGHYAVGGLASGLYRVRFSGDYRNAWYEEYYDNATNVYSATDVAVTAGSTTPHINAVLGDSMHNGRITGTVTAAGLPQAGIKVDLYQDYHGYGQWWRLVYAHTDAQGGYEIGGLKDGRYRVRFSDPGGTYATVFYDGRADLASADVITIANGATVPNVNTALTGAGAVSGSVTLSDDGAGRGVAVVAYRYNGSTWEGLGTATTNASGQYTVGGLLPGLYRLYFLDPSRTHRSEYYDNARSIVSATNVSVVTDTVTPNVNVVLDLPAPPVAQVNTSGGSVTVDPWTGQVTIMTTWGDRSDTTISTHVSCTGGLSPTNVALWMNDTPYPMTETLPGSDLYQATIPADDVANATLGVRWSCGSAALEKIIGAIVLYDPSGYITDALSGEPVAGASVTLYQVPNWLPDTPTETRNCRTVDTRGGADWSSEPDADLGLGVVVNPEMGLINDTPEISPTINPLVTNAAGHYGWDVAQGCWYVAVQAQGYETRVSPVVGVPPEVTDLDLGLTPLLEEGNKIYLPMILKLTANG